MRLLSAVVITSVAIGLGLRAPLEAQSQTAAGGNLRDPTHETRTPDVPGLTAATSTCGVSTDAAYGASPEHAIRTGGGDLYMASRQIKYLEALRGPDGQGVHFKRSGSMAPLKDADRTITDAYQVEYQGIAKPATIYMDGYHWDTPLAPKGWLCGAPMNLDPPRADPFKTSAQLLALTIAHADAYAQPIPFESTGPHTHGVVFDYVRVLAGFARAAAAKGKPLDPEELPSELRAKVMVVIATPGDCDGKPLKVSNVAATDHNGNQPRIVKRATNPKDIGSLVGGYDVPEGSMAVEYGTDNLIAGAKLVVTYEPCASAPTAAPTEFPVTVTKADLVSDAPAPPLAGMTVKPEGETVALQLFVLPDGSGQSPVYDGGAYALRDAAIAAIPKWSFSPSRINGAPILQAERVGVLVK
jgi:hypothetical protein